MCNHYDHESIVTTTATTIASSEKNFRSTHTPTQTQTYRQPKPEMKISFCYYKTTTHNDTFAMLASSANASPIRSPPVLYMLTRDGTASQGSVTKYFPHWK
ncbi:hypothetical protein HELRODRAFT_169757 [Helobdella robusta]|uniref:Uncharacterized protein n=1 Tax=Helobdella robusta TaxID=6412 RepID=T1F2A7_HELRO|nr:hypothetical protein HELRODRAFT_169757 [Helobdella robusta]ESO08033.1 hypothetical protein HELRODRAFT_169757 [Helobdella robusta]